ncbi:biotin synthase [Orbilia oligospora]|nr:biotin synthase [Orbilia oligospora]
MIFSKISVVLTGAALLQSAEAHIRFDCVRGNHDPSKLGTNMGRDEWFTGAIKRGGAKLNRFPDQFDTVVFSNPTIPGKCCSVKYKTFPRYVMEQGCGTTLKIQDTYYRKNQWRDDKDYLTKKYYEHGQEMENYRLYNFWMSPIPYGAFAPLSLVNEQAAAGKIAQATAGGWIEIDVSLVNADGGGAMKCRLDKTANANAFGQPLKILKQPWLKYNGQVAPLRVEIPAGTQCTGSFGKYKNMCLLRCENDNTAEGPFGGCVPFNLGGPSTPPPPAPVKPVEKPPAQPTGKPGVHRRFHSPGEVQLCTLMNIKTGGCTEDCSYCAQATRYQDGTGLEAKRVETVESVLTAARIAKENGSTRFCMGAAWRDMRGRKNSLKNITEMVKGVKEMGMEVCVTLGMIDGDQAKQLKDAGLTAYNHNVDTSREFYPNVITTRTYDERLKTLGHVRDAGINVCSGGILGLGETSEDRVGLLHTVSTLSSHPESFPVNALVPIKGTPLGDTPPIPFPSVLRTIATARIIMPATIIRIAAGRKTMSEEKQALCFMAGANAIFTGEKMLTTDCNGWNEDSAMFGRWGLVPMKSFDKKPVVCAGDISAARAETLV